MKLFKENNRSTKASFYSSLQKYDIDKTKYTLSMFRRLYKLKQKDINFYNKYKNRLIMLSYYGDNIEYRQKKLISLKFINTLETYVLRYGIIGEKIWKDMINNSKTTIQNMIKKYGVVEGNKKWVEFLSKSLHTREKCIEVLGEDKGNKKWEEFLKKCSKSKLLEGFIEKYGIEEGNKKFEEHKKNSCLYGIDTKSNQLTYWIKKGYSEEEAKLALSERQRTFTLEKCIEKYGYDEGVFVWQKRQEKWQSTLDLKTTKEKEEINLKKSVNDLDYFIKKYGDTEQARILFEESCTRAGYCMKPPLNEDIPGKLYYIRFWNSEIEFWKIGVTKNTVEKRFFKKEIFKAKHDLNYEIIFIKQGKLYYDCYLEEQRLLKENRANRITIDYNGFKTSEAFNKNIFSVL